MHFKTWLSHVCQSKLQEESMSPMNTYYYYDTRKKDINIG